MALYKFRIIIIINYINSVWLLCLSCQFQFKVFAYSCVGDGWLKSYFSVSSPFQSLRSTTLKGLVTTCWLLWTRLVNCAFLQVCNKGFTRLNCLRAHTNTHSDIRPYECFVCGKSFQQLNKLKLHMSTHVDDSDGKKLECGVCQKKFSSTTAVKVYYHHCHQTCLQIIRSSQSWL